MSGMSGERGEWGVRGRVGPCGPRLRCRAALGREQRMSYVNVALVTPGAPPGYDPARHNYVRKQLGMVAEGKLPVRPGRLQHV